MKRLGATGAIFICAVALILGSAVQTNGISGDRLLSDARKSYREASLVVSGECVNTFIDAEGNVKSQVIVSEVMAGKASEGRMIYLNDDLEIGESYLLYLTAGEDVPYAEDEISYNSVSDKQFAIKENAVHYAGGSISMNTLRADMEKINQTLVIPADAQYYEELESMVAASENIFLGRIENASPLKDTKLRYQAGGSTVEKSAPCGKLTVTVYGSIKGSMRYGSKVTIASIPDDCKRLISSATLESLSFTAEDAFMGEEGSVYLFFLGQDPNPKQDYLFPINPIQGLVRVDADILTGAPANTVIASYTELGALVQDIKPLIKK